MALAAGVDVGKINLDVSIAAGPVVRFDNTAKGITKLVKQRWGTSPWQYANPPAATSGCWSAVCGKPGGGASGPPKPGARFCQSLWL